MSASDYHGMDLDVTVSWSDALRRLVVTRIDVRQSGTEPVTSELLRQVAVQQFVRKAILASVRDGLTPMGADDQEPRLAFGLITADQAQACRARGPKAQTLEWVALVYRAAAAVGDPPTKTVREVFAISQSTAGAWVAAARSAGHLGDSEGPGKVAS